MGGYNFKKSVIMMTNTILSIKNLYMLYISKSDEDNPLVQLLSQESSKPAMLLSNLNLTVLRDERLGLVGESGSGKSLTVKAITGLTNLSPGILRGEIRYQNKESYVLLESNTFNHRSEKKFQIPNILKHKILINLGFHSQLNKSVIYCPPSFIFNSKTLIYLYDAYGNFHKVSHKQINYDKMNHRVELLEDHEGLSHVYLYGSIEIYLPNEKNKLINSKIIKYRKSGNNIFGKEISYTFQDPKTFLNPFWSIGKQMKNIISLYTDDQNVEKTIDLIMKEYELNPDIIKNMLPNELSGGQIQRIMILLAKISNPELLIADEPTTGLDLTLKKNLVAMYKKRKRPMIFISHDLNMVRHIAERINVIFDGEIIENCKNEDFRSNKKHHPYTKNLIQMQESGYNNNGDTNIPVSENAYFEEGCKYLRNGCPKSSKICELIAPPPIDSDKHFVSEEKIEKQWIKCWNIQ
jgi:ABC-type dipeptide/oligopeptide/nickel transport system ATPase component